MILNPGQIEFAPGLLLVGATRTKHFEDLALHPMPNYERFNQVRHFRGVMNFCNILLFQVNKSVEMKRRKEEETRMANQEEATFYKFKAAIEECAIIYDWNILSLGQEMSNMSLL